MNIKQQKGLTLIGWVIVLFFLGFFVWSGIVMFSVYWEHLKIKSALESLHDISLITREPPEKVRNQILTKLSLDYVGYERLEYYKKRIKIEKNEGRLIISIAYEIRKPLFMSFDIVGKYSLKEEIVSN